MKNWNDLNPDGDPDTELPGIRLRIALGMDVSDVALEERIIARTLDRIERAQDADDPDEPDTLDGRSSRRTSRFSWMAVAACLALVLATGMIVGPSAPAVAVPPSLVYEVEPQYVAESVHADDTLRDLAAKAEISPDEGSGLTQYVATTGWSTATVGGDRATAIVPFKRDVWIGPDGAALASERQGTALLPDGTLDPNPAVNPIDEASDRVPPGTFDGIPEALSRDPDRLRVQLLEGREPECQRLDRAGSCLIEAIFIHATTYVLPADLNSAFWRMLADTPHVHMLGRTVDRMGRPAIAIAGLPAETSSMTTVDVLLLDPETGRILGHESVSLESSLIDIDGPSVTSFTTITDSRWVAEIGNT